MDGQILASSLVSLKGTDLKMVYALLTKTHIGNLVSSKTKDLISRNDTDHFTKHLEEEVLKLEHESDEKIQVDLFLELTRALNLRGTNYSLVREVEEQCEQIVETVYEQFKAQDKKFRKFTEEQIDNTKLQMMIQYQMNQLFNEVEADFGEFTFEQQHDFAHQVNEYILSLPEDKQEQIKEKLGINELSDEMVRKAIATSGTGIVFAIIVEVSGFAFYTTATSLFASFAGFFGITLPFGFYTGLTSTIAVFANPFFLIPVLLGGGALLVNKQNKSLKKKLLPVIVMQIALPYMSGEDTEPDFSAFIEEWQERYKQYQQIMTDIEQGIEEKAKCFSQSEAIKQTVEEYEAKKAAASDLFVKDDEALKEVLQITDLDQLKINEDFHEYKQGLRKENRQKIKLQEEKDRKNTSAKGFMARVAVAFSSETYDKEIEKHQEQAEWCLEKMVEEILSSDDSFEQQRKNNMLAQMQEMERLHTLINQHERVIADLYDRRIQLDREEEKLKDELKAMDKTHYGLNHIATTPEGV